MNPEDVRRWARDQAAVAARESEEMSRRPLTAAQAFASALSLLVFDESCNGPPFQRYDPVSVREDEEARAAWTKLRERWLHGR